MIYGHTIFNFKTESYEYDVDLDSLTVEQLKDYMPQLPAALGLFDVLLLQDSEPLRAFEEVLRACTKKS